MKEIADPEKTVVKDYFEALVGINPQMVTAARRLVNFTQVTQSDPEVAMWMMLYIIDMQMGLDVTSRAN